MTATDIARTALATARSVDDILGERGLMTRQEPDDLLNPMAMAVPRTLPHTP